MLFPQLNSDVLGLRNALQSYVGPEALPEIRLAHPSGNNDEASFLRLTSWNYSLLFEAGRVTIPFLLKLPSRDRGPDKQLRESRESVRSLRTLASHNLGISDQEVNVSRKARNWLRTKCGTDSPKTRREWRDCFEHLCYEAGQIVSYCHGTVDKVLSSPDDGASTIADLKRRLDRNWPAHKFDGFVSDVCLRLGTQLDVPTFRNAHLSNWRDFLDSVADGEDIESHVIQVIERDVLSHFEDILPIDSRDIVDQCGIDPGPLVERALYRAREYMRSERYDRGQLLEFLMKDNSWQETHGRSGSGNSS